MRSNNNLVDLLAPYVEKRMWVAFNEERTKVVGFGTTALEALKKAKENHIEKPFLLRAVPDSSNLMLSYEPYG